MSASATDRIKTGNFVLGISGILIIASIFLPWGHPRNLFNELIHDYRTLLSGFLGYQWLEVFYSVGKLLVNITPVILGFTLLLGAFLPLGKINCGTCFLHHIHTLGVLACALWIFFALTFFDSVVTTLQRIAFLAGAVIFTVLSLMEVVIYMKTFRGGSSDAIHILPLILFLLLGGGGAVVLRNSEQWHIIDYVVIAIGSALGLVGIGIRNFQRRA